LLLHKLRYEEESASCPTTSSLWTYVITVDPQPAERAIRAHQCSITGSLEVPPILPKILYVYDILPDDVEAVYSGV
jgi:hypothetical protein